MEKTICPFRPSDTFRDMPCLQGKCELWSHAYTVEGRLIFGCALKLIGMTREADGKIQP